MYPDDTVESHTAFSVVVAFRAIEVACRVFVKFPLDTAMFKLFVSCVYRAPGSEIY